MRLELYKISLTICCGIVTVAHCFCLYPFGRIHHPRSKYGVFMTGVREHQKSRRKYENM
jgi:hypothetical protein